MLTTRCPQCSTTFRIRPEQLGVRGGRVRCGTCHTAFSALETLEELPDDLPPAPVVTLQSCGSGLAASSAPACRCNESSGTCFCPAGRRAAATSTRHCCRDATAARGGTSGS
ncbi:MAG: zinc-ribbon domain-containing protein [Uliginosibacterium sp.]|nr:zinc-ribbon domain-containing protein [Uliginosibacterium sp.]